MATNNVINSGTQTAHSIPVMQGTSTPSYKTLTNGQVLIGSTGADPVAATLTAGSNITITNGAGSIQISSSGGGGILLQAIQTTKTDTFSMSSTTFANVTGLSVSITPASVSSRILITAVLYVDNATNSAGNLAKLVRGSTDLLIGDAASTRLRTYGSETGNAVMPGCITLTYIDSPATTSSTTYNVQVARTGNGTTLYVNRSSTDTDSTTYCRNASMIMVQEYSS